MKNSELKVSQDIFEVFERENFETKKLIDNKEK